MNDTNPPIGAASPAAAEQAPVFQAAARLPEGCVARDAARTHVFFWKPRHLRRYSAGSQQ
jgi:hypothetical protein